MHRENHSLAGKTVRLNDRANDPIYRVVMPLKLYEIEGWWDFLTGSSWRFAQSRNIDARHYAARRIAAGLPPDDEVVYGKIDGLGRLVHATELGSIES